MMINISPRQLEVFVQVALHGSVRIAAERLHLTQPAASMALAEMERQLGSPVFARERGRLRLNTRGRELLPLAQELLERHADFARRGGEGVELGGELRIGASNSVGNYRVGELLGDFVRAHPQVAVRLRSLGLASGDALIAVDLVTDTIPDIFHRAAQREGVIVGVIAMSPEDAAEHLDGVPDDMVEVIVNALIGDPWPWFSRKLELIIDGLAARRS